MNEEQTLLQKLTSYTETLLDQRQGADWANARQTVRGGLQRRKARCQSCDCCASMDEHDESQLAEFQETQTEDSFGAIEDERIDRMHDILIAVLTELIGDETNNRRSLRSHLIGAMDTLKDAIENYATNLADVQALEPLNEGCHMIAISTSFLYNSKQHHNLLGFVICTLFTASKMKTSLVL
ncbi:hypothetical protein GOP47_0019642 [Adiantum capillus-veneris]|uniref:Uncharacterized protein n=1 Tax=Adiantum capillus-veneris TaxID=13818 RepID=A0A9D4UC67_ADICA|nr:hypothetical protein GOP47_0019642 [Adiantum capillus-veneris]